MRTVLYFTAMLAGLVCMGSLPATAGAEPTPGIAAANGQGGLIEDVGWRRRCYWRYGAPYAYYPPAYDYYVPPAYGYYVPAYPPDPYYRPYRYYRPYYAPYY